MQLSCRCNFSCATQFSALVLTQFIRHHFIYPRARSSWFRVGELRAHQLTRGKKLSLSSAVTTPGLTIPKFVGHTHPQGYVYYIYTHARHLFLSTFVSFYLCFIHLYKSIYHVEHTGGYLFLLLYRFLDVVSDLGKARIVPIDQGRDRT